MTDIHCHIIPEVDDGAWSMDAALEMAQIAARSGVDTIVATPHFQGIEESLETLPRIYSQFLRLQRAVTVQGVPIKLICGAEVLCVPQTLELARRGKLPTLGDSRYVLTEFYFDASARFMDETLEELHRLGYRPVVAHPERYEAVQHDPDLAGSWFARGFAIQLNKGSIAGAFGRRAQTAAMTLLRRGNVHVIASDGHSPEQRTPDFVSIRNWCRENLGRTYTQILLEDNPGRIAAGRPLRSVE